MKYNLLLPAIFLLFVFTFSSCENDPVHCQENVYCENYVVWIAHPFTSIGDGKVQLRWMRPMSWGPPPNRPIITVDPDYFIVYFAENDMSNFRRLIELDRSKLQQDGRFYTHIVDNLQNGNSYFFYLVSKKEGIRPVRSDTIMVVPNRRKSFETLSISGGHVSVSYQRNKIAFSASHTWNNGNNEAISVFISNTDGSERELIRISAHQPSWSPVSNKLAFSFAYVVPQEGRWFDQIAIYNYETKTFTQLTRGGYSNGAPVFSENGEFLLYHSTRNAPTFNIWLFNLKTLESHQITDIAQTSLAAVYAPRWIDNDRFLFSGICSVSRRYQILESSISTRQINKVFDSKWNDSSPAISPDQRKIAFISDRASRINQVWIYHIDTNTYTQITGYSIYEHVGQHSYIEWLDNSTIVFTISDNQGFRAVKQRIE